MNLCILMPTFDRYRPLAELNMQVLDRLWPSHPPVFCCGVPGMHEEPWLTLRDDPTDWIGFVHSGVQEMRQRGYDKCYLICEEHLPLFRCHEEHLNLNIPNLMDALSAVRIGLHGWGQGRSVNGHVLTSEKLWLENLSPEFLWKYELHPALWSLEALQKVLDALMRELSIDMRSPWGFERQTGKKGSLVPEAFKAKSFRICGIRTSASPARVWRVRVERSLVRAVRFAAGRIFGEKAWRRINDEARFLLHYYEGPYPLFRRGVMAGDRLNKDLIRFLKLHGGRRMAREIAVAAGAVRG